MHTLYSRDNGLNLLCSKRDAGREKPEIAEGFTGQGRDTVICTWSTYESVWGFVGEILRAWASTPLCRSLLPRPQSEGTCPALSSGRSQKMKNNSGATPEAKTSVSIPESFEKGRCLVSVGLSFWLEIKLCCGLAADLSWIAFLHICQNA